MGNQILCRKKVKNCISFEQNNINPNQRLKFEINLREFKGHNLPSSKKGIYFKIKFGNHKEEFESKTIRYQQNPIWKFEKKFNFTCEMKNLLNDKLIIVFLKRHSSKKKLMEK